MNYCVMDKNYKVVGLFSHRKDALDACPHDGFIGITLWNKEETQKRISRRLSIGLKPLVWMKTKKEIEELCW